MKGLMNTKVGQKVEKFFVTHPKTEKVVKGTILTVAAFFAAKNVTDAQIRDYNKINAGVKDTSAYVVENMPMQTSFVGIERGSLTDPLSGAVQYEYLKGSAKVGLGVHSRNSSKDTAFWRNLWNGILAITPDYVFVSASAGAENLNKSILNGDLGDKTLNIYTAGFGYEGTTTTNLNPTLLDARFSYTVIQDYTNGTPLNFPVVLSAGVTIPAKNFTFSASGGVELSKLNGKFKQTAIAYRLDLVRFLNDVFMDGYNVYLGAFNTQTGTSDENLGLVKQRQNASGLMVGASPTFGGNQLHVNYETNLQKNGVSNLTVGYTDLWSSFSISGYFNQKTDPQNVSTSASGVKIQYYW